MRHFKSLCLKQFLLQVFPSPVERFFAILSLVSVFKFISLNNGRKTAGLRSFVANFSLLFRAG
ncbi:hypothetical protein PPHE_a0966 [Pseudoalteromonas phenolica O-BC30]|nr:hypothetical protein [Pseudoalteromonas phenolica O-BC30]